MEWYWIALGAGIIAPWALFARDIRLRFEEFGFLGGITYWLGMCLLTVPIMLVVTWAGRLVFG